jgi:hypothetical protein
MEPAHYPSSPLAVDWAERATARYRCEISHVLENGTFRDVAVRSGTTACFPKRMRLKIAAGRSSEENSPVMMRDSCTCARRRSSANRSSDWSFVPRRRANSRCLRAERSDPVPRASGTAQRRSAASRRCAAVRRAACDPRSGLALPGLVRPLLVAVQMLETVDHEIDEYPHLGRQMLARPIGDVD